MAYLFPPKNRLTHKLDLFVFFRRFLGYFLIESRMTTKKKLLNVFNTVKQGRWLDHRLIVNHENCVYWFEQKVSKNVPFFWLKIKKGNSFHEFTDRCFQNSSIEILTIFFFPTIDVEQSGIENCVSQRMASGQFGAHPADVGPLVWLFLLSTVRVGRFSVRLVLSVSGRWFRHIDPQISWLPLLVHADAHHYRRSAHSGDQCRVSFYLYLSISLCSYILCIYSMEPSVGTVWPFHQ